MYRNWTTANLIAELQEIARDLLAADPDDQPGMFARYSRVESELSTRRTQEGRRVAA